MANGTPWKVADRWTTASGKKIIKYENGIYECDHTLFPSLSALREAIGSTHR